MFYRAFFHDIYYTKTKVITYLLYDLNCKLLIVFVSMQKRSNNYLTLLYYIYKLLLSTITLLSKK